MTFDPANPLRQTRCLNGWWDFLPVYDAQPLIAPPRAGWHAHAYLVPSWWNKPLQAVRTKGATVYHNLPGKDAPVVGDEHEFLFDAYGYPTAWTNARAAWMRRTVTIDALPAHRRVRLVFDAVAPQCTVFVNGERVAHDTEALLPIELDITAALRVGANELALLVTDFTRDARGRTLAPSGNSMTSALRGIWQDVRLVEHSDVFVSDVTIRTSTRRKTIAVQIAVTNTTDTTRTIRCDADLAHWRKHSPAHTARRAMTLGARLLTIAPGATATLAIARRWPAARWWQPGHPKLYVLRTRLSDGTGVVDTHAERFGFREVWLDGPHLMLNDHPIHLFSDWGHKFTPFHHTAQWIRQWFGMLRDAHLNHTRLHTHPHPPLTLDLADEEGILVTGETGMHGSGGGQAADEPAYWEHVRAHVRRFVRRDKNHPCLILWSVENEMRWNRDTTSRTREELPQVRALFTKLDPTRPAYHEGDSSLWQERTQALISRHYNKECSGLGWWDRTQPLHAGEMALYHYAGPNNTCHLAGDLVWADYRVMDRAAATDAALIIEAGRTLGVCCFGPWNLSCLENLRRDRVQRRLAYADYTAPGVKPLLVQPHASEFAFWTKGKGYTPFVSFAIQARAFRPLAVIDRSLRTQYGSDARCTRELFVVNDTATLARGILRARIMHNQRVVAQTSWPLRIARGAVAARTFAVTLPATLAGTCIYDVRFTAGGGRRDAWQRRIIVAQPHPPLHALARVPIAVFGPGTLRHALDALGLSYHYVASLQADTLDSARIVVLEAHTVTPEADLRAALHAFAHGGGRVIVLEQQHSIFPALPLEDKPVLRVFTRAYRHPVLAGLADTALGAWDDDAYCAPAGTACVARKMYRKNGRQNVTCLLDADESGFGGGGFAFMALCEAPVGDGLVIACQLRVTDTCTTIPAAQQLLVNMLRRAHTYRAPAVRPPVMCDGADAAAAVAALAQARAGANVIINDATDATLTALGRALKLPLRTKDVGDIYQLVRVARDPVLNGISNEDTCGIERFSYCNDEVNLRVASRCLMPVRRLEPLLATATQSCLREFFVGDGKTEPLRAHTVSRFLFAERPARAIGLGRIRVGAGALYLNQFAPPLEARARFHMLSARLAANLGARRHDSVLDAGPCIAPAARSNGTPASVWVLADACDAALRAQLIRCARYAGERIAPSGMLAVASWRELRGDDGGVHATHCGTHRPVWLFYRLESPAPRKNLKLDIDVPNPAALTFLHAAGAGALELFVNGSTRGTQTINGDNTVFSDLELEHGWNQILVAWTPLSADASLKMTWRTITAQSETLFYFL